jgi:hypothetical protein
MILCLPASKSLKLQIKSFGLQNLVLLIVYYDSKQIKRYRKTVQLPGRRKPGKSGVHLFISRTDRSFTFVPVGPVIISPPQA